MRIKHFVVFLALLLLLPVSSSARELVITLKSGRRVAYHITSDNTQTVCLTATEDAISLNGDGYAISDIKELRIYAEVPEGAEVVDAIADVADDSDSDAIGTIYDLSGRARGLSLSRDDRPGLPKGIYIINHKKYVKP